MSPRDLPVLQRLQRQRQPPSIYEFQPIAEVRLKAGCPMSRHIYRTGSDAQMQTVNGTRLGNDVARGTKAWTSGGPKRARKLYAFRKHN